MTASEKENPPEKGSVGETPAQDTTDVVKCRFVFGVMACVGIAVLFALRVNLSVAIVCMVKSNGTSKIVDSDDVCEVDNSTASANKLEGEFAWDEERQGLLLAGFFWGYAAGQLPGGLLAERYGGKLVMGLGVLVTALATLATAPAARAHWGALFAVRLVEGLAESVTLPAAQLMVAKWAPPQERSRFALVYTGVYIGTVITMPLSGWLCDMDLLGGWPLVFYVTGAAGVLWFVPWQFCAYDSPAQHPRITQEERRYIEESLGSLPRKKAMAVPWRKMLATPGLWACVTMHTGIAWTFYVLLTCGPTYMSNILHFDIKSNAALSAIPYVAGAVASFFFSWLLDFINAHNIVSKINGFRIFNGITAVGPAATMLLVPVVGCDRATIIALFGLNGLFMGAQYAGNNMNLLVLAPNFAGTIFGISNTFANGAGILAPYVIGFLTNNNQTRTAWNIAFWISGGIGLGTYAVYLVFATADEQPWNNPPNVHSSPEHQAGMALLEPGKRHEFNTSHRSSLQLAEIAIAHR